MIENIMQIVSPIFAALIAYYIGMKVYFKQKEYDIVRQRYLDQSLDILCANVDNMLVVFRSNWAQSLWICQLFRDAGKNLGKEYYTSKFQKFDHSLFTLTPFFRLRLLIDDQIFWEATQELVAFVEKTTSFFENDLLTAIKVYIDSDIIKVDHKTIYEEYVPSISDFEKESHKFYDLISGLLVLASVLEKEKFSYKGIHKFKMNDDVAKTVAKLKELFPKKYQ
jgi:hypothetical protein